jgi:hypothetical protein
MEDVSKVGGSRSIAHLARNLPVLCAPIGAIIAFLENVLHERSRGLLHDELSVAPPRVGSTGSGQLHSAF